MGSDYKLDETICWAAALFKNCMVLFLKMRFTFPCRKDEASKKDGNSVLLQRIMKINYFYILFSKVELFFSTENGKYHICMLLIKQYLYST